MTSPSPPSKSEPLELVPTLSPSTDPAESIDTKQISRGRKYVPSIKVRLISWAIALSTLPILAVGTSTYLTSVTLNEQLSAPRQTGSSNQDEIQSTLQSRIPPLLIGTAAMAILSGSLIAWLLNRELRPLFKAAQHSNQLVNRLYRRETSTEPEAETPDKLFALVENIDLIEAQLPRLLHSQEHEAARAELLMQFIGQLHIALSEEDLFQTTVAEVRQILQTDRVTVFALNPDGEGTFVAESVAPGYPKLQWSSLHDPCFSEGYQEQYRQGRVRAIDNIHQAGLNDCHIGLLERFAVKANIVAPILQKDQLFGLLIAHQCARPREWHQSDIELFRQLALQVGYALDRARNMSELDSQVNQLQLLMHFTELIRGSLQSEEILSNSVQESRKVLRADRVIVYRFDENWQGTVAAEAVQPGVTKMIWAKIADPCFADKYVEQYRRGRVQAISSVYKAGLTDCHLQQLEKYGVQANLVVPILVGENLFGLLIAHQCSGPRIWKPSEVDLLTQIGIQIGHALEQANVLTRMEQDWIANATHTHEDNQELQVLQNKLSEYLRTGRSSIQFLTQGADQHLETAQSVYTQLQAMIDFAQDINIITRQFQSHNHQILAQVESAQNYIDENINRPHELLAAAQSAATQLQGLEKNFQQISQVRILVSQLSSQIQLQAMNISTKATQDSISHQELASSTKNISSIAQKLDDNMTQMKRLIESLQQELQHKTAMLEPLTQGISNQASQRFQPTPLSTSLSAEMAQLNTQIVQITQLISSHLQTSSTASHQSFELSQFLQLLATQAKSMQTSIQQLEAMVPDDSKN